jgi:hypothetical protein
MEARLEPVADGASAGEGNSGLGRVRIELRPMASRRCEARITRSANTSILSLTRTDLPGCEAPTNPPVRCVGGWGNIIPYPHSSTARRLLQIWLWEDATEGRGRFASDLASRGMRRDFVFSRHFHAPARSRSMGPASRRSGRLARQCIDTYLEQKNVLRLFRSATASFLRSP